MPPPYCYDYPRPSVTVDLAIFAVLESEIRVLLIRRKHDPFAGRWALPGGFLEMDETIEAGARRELKEETGLEAPGAISFLGAYGDPGRDPRGRTISMAHAAVIRGKPPEVSGSDDAEQAAWRPARSGEPLAFDHDAMLTQALEWLQAGVRQGPLGLELLPTDFTREAVQGLFQALFDSPRGASQWLARLAKLGLIEARAGSKTAYQTIPVR